MRKLLILCMMFCLSLSLVGCQKNPVSQNQENNQTNENTNTNQDQEEIKQDGDTNKDQVGTNENTQSEEINKEEDTNKDQEVSNENNKDQEEDKTRYINEEGILQLNLSDVAMNYLGNEVTYPYDIDDMMKVELPVDPSYPSVSIPAKSYQPLEMYFDFENHYVLCPQFFNGSEDEMLVSDSVAYNLEF